MARQRICLAELDVQPDPVASARISGTIRTTPKRPFLDGDLELRRPSERWR
ncbi:MAG: hypothetical protein WD468_12250 [Pirellulales bacterium]